MPLMRHLLRNNCSLDTSKAKIYFN